MRKIMIHLCYITLIFCACNQRSSDMKPGVVTQPSAPMNESQIQVSTSNPPVVMKLVKHQVINKEGTGIVASTYLLPEGWTVRDRLYWEYKDPTVPIRRDC